MIRIISPNIINSCYNDKLPLLPRLDVPFESKEENMTRVFLPMEDANGEE
jgi:hypothetical protein